MANNTRKNLGKIMRYQLVDQITQIQPLKSIKGIKLFSNNEASLIKSSSTKMTISPALIIEAVGQLGSWLVKASLNFVIEPLITYVEGVNMFKEVSPGCLQCLEAKLISLDNKTSNLLLQVYEYDEVVMKIDRVMFVHLPVNVEYSTLSKDRFNALLR